MQKDTQQKCSSLVAPAPTAFLDFSLVDFVTTSPPHSHTHSHYSTAIEQIDAGPKATQRASHKAKRHKERRHVEAKPWSGRKRKKMQTILSFWARWHLAWSIAYLWIKTILEQNQFYSIISSVCTTQVYRQPFQLW